MRRFMDSNMLGAETGAGSKAQPDRLQAHEAALAREHAGVSYVVLEQGTDLRFKSGRYAGMSVSDLIRTPEGRDYLGGLWKTANAEMRAVIKSYFSP